MRKYPNQMTLGELIDALTTMPKDEDVVFDFCRLHVTGTSSYRGYYDNLALNWDGPSDIVKVVDLSVKLRAAVGATFIGYKGGHFKMHRKTPVWVARPGETGDTIVTHVVRTDYAVVLVTANGDVDD